jgi:hypothetical protein
MEYPRRFHDKLRSRTRYRNKKRKPKGAAIARCGAFRHALQWVGTILVLLSALLIGGLVVLQICQG